MASLDALLTLQEIDTTLDQLRHRRETLAERAELAAARTGSERAAAAVDSAFAELHAIQNAERAREDEAATVGAKVVEVERTLYGGTVTAAKELEAYQADLAMLKDRQARLEDEALEMMEQAEPLAEALEQRRQEAEAAATELESAEARLASAETEIDAEIARVEAGRADAADGLPSDVLDQYGLLRRALGGVGAARLTGARCEGCHLEIPSAQLEEVRREPDDALVTCPECGRILVR